jgi:ubiquinone biosynthesis protein UbiJ
LNIINKEQAEDALIKYYGKDLARAIVRVIEGSETIATYGIYDDSFDLSLRIQAMERTIDSTIGPTIDDLITENAELKDANKELEKRIHGLENVIKPDETDVHNINRRIELLAQRISELESKKRGLFR